jgi:hypothetical protein
LLPPVEKDGWKQDVSFRALNGLGCKCLGSRPYFPENLRADLTKLALQGEGVASNGTSCIM